MQFKLQATAIKVLWANDTRDSFLYSLQETIVNNKTSETYTKSWAVWSRIELLVGHTYDVDGYITEAPNKGYMNEQGKVAYKANYNATKCDDLTDFDMPNPSDYENPPVFDENETIPF